MVFAPECIEISFTSWDFEHFKWIGEHKMALTTKKLMCNSAKGDKSGNDQEEARLQNASRQIVHTAIQQAVQQLSQESQRKEKGTKSSVSLQLERGQLTKKHEKK
ncbi:A-kinase anchor protein inhibitor 1 [Varanus komodoensis]|nr:A-kinase anchor protein inhibitor 1 [Varanus komodoensis]